MPSKCWLRSGSAGVTGVIGREEGWKAAPFEGQGEVVSRETVTLGAFGEAPEWKNLFNPTMMSVRHSQRPDAAAA
jgi:hypothetical protein